MKRTFLIACIALLGFVSTSFAQGIEVGFGIAAPVSSRAIVTQAHNDELGVVRADKVLDAGPQLFLELHKTYKVNKHFAVGPMVGVTPKVDLGTTSNLQTEQPIGGGFGLAVQIPSKVKQHINVGVVWMVTSPIQQLADGWQPGFQAPRTGTFGIPMTPQYKQASLSRFVLTFSVSGFFR